MNFKRIVSAALVCVMMFASVAAFLPVKANAAYSSEVDSSTKLPLDDIKAIVNTALNGKYATDLDMLQADLDLGYLDHVTSSDGKYTIYVNRFTGVMYYKNNVTGQILSSSPADMKYKESVKTDELLSQVIVEFYETSIPDNEYRYLSTTWAAQYGQISIQPIANGLRVNYTLGDTTTRFLLPGMLKQETFMENIMKPIVKYTENLVKEFTGDELDYFAGDTVYDEYGGFSLINLRNYYSKTIKSYVNKLPYNSEERNTLNDNYAGFNDFISKYTLYNPAYYEATMDFNAESWEENCIRFPILKEGVAIVVRGGSDEPAALKASAEFLSKHTEYSFSQMYEDERVVGYVDQSKQKPVIRCALEYSFNEDGSLSVTLPATSITFDETVYTLKNVICLPYFGAADMNNKGYALYPDGSGTIIEFDDVYNPSVGIENNMVLTSAVYGKDYCYSTITGAHREQVYMPVFGMVSDRPTNAEMQTKLSLPADSRYTGGFFAIVEEGASLSTINFKGQASANKFITSYTSYNPYPSDTFDLSQTISVGSLGMYTITSESKYTGSYVTRFVMLSDKTVKTTLADGTPYDATYSGMAEYYRDYLYKNGVLSAVDVVSEDIPLYIEALGSMTIDAKFLSFPITKNIPLTTFNDVLLMYKQLLSCKDEAYTLWQEYQALADAETDALIKAEHQNQADKYKDIYENAQNISNINFKLTGFANGGMYYRYPAKLKWERVLGGKRAFRNLISEAQKESAKEGINFGVYPDFNFMYIENTGVFDGIGNRNNVSRMVDNRYASRQSYDTIKQMYETEFAMVISPDVLAKFFGKFERKYQKYDSTSISLSNLGHDLNSNFDKKNPINREEALEYVQTLLADVSSRYDVMLEGGNAYAIQYATHILNAAIDASHFKYASYTIPFVGMVMHGSVNYAGTALNYSGSPKYEILRAIESGASPYYVLCYQNSAYLKEDEVLSEYYSVDYHNWYQNMVKTYTTINQNLKGLQDYYITEHRTVIAERIIDEDEVLQNFEEMKAGVLKAIETQLEAAITAKFNEANRELDGFTVTVDKDALMAQTATLLGVELADLAGDFETALDALILFFKDEYEQTGANPVGVTFNKVEYDTSRYVTGSFATDKDYQFTDYTIDNGNVVMVTYEKDGEIVRFLLNYNIYKVKVTLADGEEYVLDNYGFVKIDG